MTTHAAEWWLLAGGPAGAAPRPPAGPLQRILTDGRFFVTEDGQTYRMRFASCLYVMARTPEERAAVLAENVELGFNGIRVFAGELTGRGQTAESARAALPGLLEDAAAHGLHVFVSINTDSGSGYDVEAHTMAQASACNAAVNAITEGANEPYHDTQSEEVNDFAWLLDMMERTVPPDLPFCLGAAREDEPTPEGTYPTDGGEFNTAHLNRGGDPEENEPQRDKWNMIRRIREIENISAVTGKHAVSGEPIGAGEVTIQGKREADPAVFFAMGALCRGFEVGMVFHSEDGLNARPLGPNQRVCAQDCIAGWNAIDTDERLAFKNAGWSDSPIASADFDAVVRAYSFIAGNAGYTVLVGLMGDPKLEFANGWHPVETIAERPGCSVLRIAR